MMRGEGVVTIYLHYALDVWFEEIVRAHCTGHIYLCRYADDLSVHFNIVKMRNAFTRR